MWRLRPWLPEEIVNSENCLHSPQALRQLLKSLVLNCHNRKQEINKEQWYSNLDIKQKKKIEKLFDIVSWIFNFSI